MNLFRIILLLLAVFLIQEPANAVFNYSTLESTPYSVEKGQEKRVKKKKTKPRKTDDEKPFPIWSLASVLSGFLGFAMFFLAIAFNMPLYVGIIGGILALGAIILGIIALKKGNSKVFSYVGIVIGSVGVLATIMFIISFL